MKKVLLLLCLLSFTISYSQKYIAEISQGAVLPDGQKDWVIITEVYIVLVSKDGKEKRNISREYSWRDYSNVKDLKANMKKLKEWAEPYRYKVEQKLYSFNNMISED